MIIHYFNHVVAMKGHLLKKTDYRFKDTLKVYKSQIKDISFDYVIGHSIQGHFL